MPYSTDGLVDLLILKGRNSTAGRCNCVWGFVGIESNVGGGCSRGYLHIWRGSNRTRSMVLATTDIWRDTVTSQTPNAPKATAALYAPDAVLWGTVSEEVRDTPEEILDYFEYFACLPGLSLIEYNPVAVRVYGDFATNVGTYTFAWTGEGGEKKEKRARYSFTYRRDPNCLTGWAMVEHHSSAMPVSPPALKHARS
ncbi:unnamed protein product [Choristocarpus tenellus]